MDSAFDAVNLNESEEDGSDDEEASLIDGDERKASTESKRVWDSFREIPPKQDSGSLAKINVIEYSKRILKFLAYVITFFVVLGAGALAKTLLLLMTSQLNPASTQYACISEKKIATFYPVPEERVLWTWVLFLVFCVPEFGVLVRAGRIVFFKNNELPKFVNFLFVFAMESLHVIGVAILVFEVLPQLDTIRGALLTNAVCIVPGVLRMLSRDTSEVFSKLKLFIDGLAILMQVTALFVWPIVDENPRLGLIAPALILTSAGWWMNFIPLHPPADKGLISGFLRFLCSVRVGINTDTMYWTYLILCLWKVLLFFSFMLIIIQVQGDMDVTTFFNTTPSAFAVHNMTANQSAVIAPRTLVIFADETYTIMSWELGWLWIGIVQACCAYACYAFAKFACKILIQEFSMSLANVLTVPATIVLLVVFHEYRNGEQGDLCFFTDSIPPYIYWNTLLDVSLITDKYAWIWVLWLVSQIWISLHIWFPRCERLARTEKLFATPMFSSILIDQSVCLNRTVDEEVVIVDEGIEDDDCVPHVIACATMWHESKEEMLEMLKAIIRLDLDQCTRRIAKETLDTVASRKNYYTFETHILFDDVFELESEGGDSYVLNGFVKDMLVALPQAVREVHRSNRIKISLPEKLPTPYGGRLVYTLPGRTKMYVHLKDKNKIRHRKRWSQCMYMYYLLGFRLMERPISSKRKEKIAHNTFLLALDGDIDFQPKAVLLLVDLMKKNDNLGAACGRIHPVGSGLMAWYQTFEYAIGHWLQKATEHMIGCVLCSPGCFSLFRGRALMDDNVMRTYTKDCDVARHYVQYDQGEDRWLCTLLLQRGYRVEYSAASDAYTHCPENFNEFYNQRRRWVPSTMANIMDLLGSYKQTIKINGNISLPYVLYQTMLLAGTILGPGTIFLMLVGAFVAAFKIDNWTSFIYNLVPIILYIGICLFLSSKIQLGVALIISTVYGLVMMAVLVGILIQIYEDGPLAPSTLFLFVVAGEMIVAALMHPEELHCLPSGAIYYVTIPSMYLLLIIYSVCNLNVVSWGTREVATKKTRAELEEEKKAAAETQTKQKKGDGNAILSFLESFAPANMKETGSIDFSFAGLFRCMFCTQPQEFDEKEHLLRIGDSLVGVKNRLDSIERLVDPTAPATRRQSRRRTTASMNAGIPLGAAMEINNAMLDEEELKEEEDEGPSKETRDDMLNPYWIEDDCLRKGKVNFMPTEETKFWKEMIGRYLTPIDEDKEKKKKIEGDLRELRDKMVLTFFMLNALFVTVIFLLQLNKDIIYINWPLGVKSNITYDPFSHEVEVTQTFLQLEPIGLTFVLFFAIILIIQFTGMFLHRFETLCHVLSVTEMFPSQESLFDFHEMVESAKKGVHEINESEKSDQKLDEDLVSRRKTVQIIEDEMRSERKPSVNLDDALKKYFVNKQNDDRIEAEKRQSSSANRFSRRISGLARNSLAPKRVTMAHTNPGFATITEDEKEEI